MKYEDGIIDPRKLKAARLAKGDREGRKILQRHVAEAIHTDQRYISRLERGKVKTSNFIFGIAKFLGVHPEDLLLKNKKDFSVTIRIGNFEETYKQNPNHPLFGVYIPVIPLEDIGKKIRTAEDIADRRKFKHVPLMGKGGSNCFAVIWESDSMSTNSTIGEDFRDGYLLQFDPQRKPRQNSYVLVYEKGAKAAVFRQLSIQGGVDYLKPLNPQYPVKKLKTRSSILGVLIYAGKSYDD